MADAQKLFAVYIAEHRAGGRADPREYLARAPEDERRLLAALIDAYLARAPRAGAEQTPAEVAGLALLGDRLERALAGSSGLWPVLLPTLRDRAGLRRSQLVKRLAHELGVEERSAKVTDYYHRMELGLLPAAGVSDRVLEALGAILGERADALRRAGGALRAIKARRPPDRRNAAGPAFARRASGEPAPRSQPSAARTDRDAPRWDEIDRLFCGPNPGASA